MTTAMPNRVTARHRELAAAYMHALENSESADDPRVMAAFEQLRHGWRGCSDSPVQAAHSARAILAVPRRVKRPHGSGRHPVKGLRCPNDLWEAAEATAALEGRSIGAAIREFLTGYAADHLDQQEAG